MISGDMILQVSAIMILGILVIADLARKIGWPVAGTTLIFCVSAIGPFTISAISVLMGSDIAGTAWAIAGFLEFFAWLTAMLIKESRNERKIKDTEA